MDLLLDQVELFRKNLLKANRMVRELAKNSKYHDLYENLISIPGVGTTAAMCLLTEIDDINRFHNQREFTSLLGLSHHVIVVARQSVAWKKTLEVTNNWDH